LASYDQNKKLFSIAARNVEGPVTGLGFLVEEEITAIKDEALASKALAI